jgi:hypothetical protein
MLGAESIVMEVDGSYARPKKSCNMGCMSKTRLEWHILKTRLRDDVDAKAEGRLIVGRRQVQSGPALNFVTP